MIGKRPIDLHLYALKSLGAIISEKTENSGRLQKTERAGDKFS